MTIKPFTLLEDYQKQVQAASARRDVYQQKVDEAKQTFEDAKVTLDAIIGEEITTGVEAKTAKTAARKAVEQADKDVSQAEAELRQANTILSSTSGSIKEIDVVKAYIYDYVPSVKEQEMPAIKERMAQGQALILSAMADFYKLKGEYHELNDPIKNIDHTARSKGQQDSNFSIPNPFEDHRSTGFDEHDFGRLLTNAKKGITTGVEYIEKAFELEGK